MTATDLETAKQWFSEYTQSFYSDNEEDQKNIMIKVEHSRKVYANMDDIVKNLSLDESRRRLAVTIALFHDIGRFPQYAEYRTFRDADSVNHGLLGSQTLARERVLQNLPGHEQHLISNAVTFHNAYAIPATQKDEEVFFLKLIRDADKVDILRVFIEYYETPKEDRASATAFGVPDTPEYSHKMLSRIYQKRIASYSDIQTENDFKLMKLSWVYDMHFDASLRLLQKNNYIARIIEKLPQTDEIRSAMDILMQYVSERLGNG